MKLTDEQKVFLARFNITERAMDQFTPSGEAAVTVRDRDIFIDGPIVSTMEEKFFRAFGLEIGLVSPFSFRKALEQIPTGDITVSINSPGGSVFDGSSIQSMIVDRRENDAVATYVRGVAASAASSIAFAGSPIQIAPMAMIMVHRSVALSYGHGEDLRKTATILDKVDDAIAEQLFSISKMSKGDAVKAVADETWYNAKEALELGIVDTITSPIESGETTRASAQKHLSALAAHLQFNL